MTEESQKTEESKKEEVRDVPRATRHSISTTSAVLIVVGIIVLLGGGLIVGKRISSRRSVRGIVSNRMMNRPMMRGGRAGSNRANGGGGIDRGMFSGNVTKIDGDTLTISANGKDVQVKIADTTSIYKSSDIAKKSDISAGSQIIVRGQAGSDGIVQAQFIEIK